MLRFLLIIFGAWITLEAQPVLSLTNLADLNIESLEVRGATERTWSSNVLSSPLPPQTLVEIQMANPKQCRFEVRGKDENGRILFNSTRLDICRNSLTYNGSYFLQLQPKNVAPTSAPISSAPQNIQLVNGTTTHIHALYVRISGQRQWSANLLENRALFLSEGEAQTFLFSELSTAQCTVDIWAEGLGQRRLGMMRNVNLCTQSTVILRFTTRK